MLFRSCALGKAHMFSKVMYLCIGTGCGSAFSIDGCLSTDETKGIPPKGWVYNTPFRDSIIDDYISIRGLKELSGKFMKEPLSGLDLFHLAQKNDSNALACFLEFGKNGSGGYFTFFRKFFSRLCSFWRTDIE